MSKTRSEWIDPITAAAIGPAGGGGRPHHAPEFEMNEAGLPVGLRVGLAVMRSALGS
jgi:hypothetical protein